MKKIKLSVFLAVCLFLFLIQLWWLALFILSGGAIYYLFKADLKPVRLVKKYTLLKGALVFTGVVVLAIYVRLFIFEVYLVPSSSMEGTIHPGDKILVSKVKCGPALPRSPYKIPWVNLFFYMDAEAGANPDSSWWKHRRLSGFGEYERGDVLVFTHPRFKQAYIKRCIGLPGDTVEVRSGQVFINNKAIKEPALVSMPYRVKVNQPDGFRKILKEDGVRGRWKSPDEFEAQLTTGQAEEYASYKIVDYIEPVVVDYSPDRELFPGKSLFHHSKWSIDNYGPYVVPRKGMKIPINAITDNHYWFLIKYREGNEQGLSVQDGDFYLGDTLITHYEFKKDYYFFMGDNRHDSNDSRYWGPIQEDMVIGVADMVLFSNNEQGFKWDRLFKLVR